jgi:hypothetical protein
MTPVTPIARAAQTGTKRCRSARRELWSGPSTFGRRSVTPQVSPVAARRRRVGVRWVGSMVMERGSIGADRSPTQMTPVPPIA